MLLHYCTNLFFIIFHNDAHSVLHDGHGPATIQIHLGLTNGRVNIGTNNKIESNTIISGKTSFFILLILCSPFLQHALQAYEYTHIHYRTKRGL